MAQPTIQTLMQRIGYTFNKPEWLVTALTHRSYAGENPGTEHNERLEFLGDAVLGLVVGRMLYLRMPGASEGRMSRVRAALVSEGPLSGYAKTWGLGLLLRLGRGEEATQGREKPSILADAYEALIGALFLDGGLEAAQQFIENSMADRLEHIDEDMLDSKTALQEWAQARSMEPVEYRLVSESGPPHDKVFTMQVYVAGTFLGEGVGRSKKEAEQAAARQARAGL